MKKSMDASWKDPPEVADIIKPPATNASINRVSRLAASLLALFLIRTCYLVLIHLIFFLGTIRIEETNTEYHIKITR